MYQELINKRCSSQSTCAKEKAALLTEPLLFHFLPIVMHAERMMLAYLAKLGETVEELLPDHEVSVKFQIAKQLVEDERLLSLTGSSCKT